MTLPSSSSMYSNESWRESSELFALRAGDGCGEREDEAIGELKEEELEVEAMAMERRQRVVRCSTTLVSRVEQVLGHMTVHA